MNNVQLIGRVGQEPESRHLSDGNQLATFTVATREYNDETAWHNVICWGKTAEIVAKYLHKGDTVGIEGRLKYDEYEKDGVKRKTTKINASKVHLIGGKREGTSTDAPDNLPF